MKLPVGSFGFGYGCCANICVDDMGACRLYGSLNVNKVASNLHITSDGHGYASSQHTSHDCK